MNKRNQYRDENFAKHVEELEVAFDDLSWGRSPVIDAVNKLRAQLGRDSSDKRRAA